MLAFEIAVGSIALVFVIYLTKVILKHDQGTKEMQEISNATRKGALAFLKREYQHALDGRETPDCQYKACNACGLERWQPDCQRKYKGSS